MIRHARAVFLTLFAAALPCAAQQAAVAPAALTYVGSDTCGTCHEDIAKALGKSRHDAINTEDKHGFAGKACESCHGPGSKHVETLSAADIRNPAKLAPAEVNRACLTCHVNRPTAAGRIQNGHARNQISCIQCHSIHGTAPEALVATKPATVNAQCESCHLDVKTSFQRPFRHRIIENAMTCVDCHNPHGSFRPGNMQMASANEPGCFKCHGDKRGPFTFEHAPVREEGCASCHEPHGSSNAKMLVRQEVRLVCLECHANLPNLPGQVAATQGVVPPAFHDMVSPQYRNCTVCHQKVHGSYIDRNLLR